MAESFPERERKLMCTERNLEIKKKGTWGPFPGADYLKHKGEKAKTFRRHLRGRGL